MSVNVRMIKDETKIITVLLQHQRSWKYLKYSGVGTDAYRTITRWCVIPDHLTPIANGISRTSNGLVYDEVSASFVHLEHDEFVSLDFSKMLPSMLANYVSVVDVQLVYEKAFPTHLLKLMEENGGISERFSLSPSLVVQY